MPGSFEQLHLPEGDAMQETRERILSDAELESVADAYKLKQKNQPPSDSNSLVTAFLLVGELNRKRPEQEKFSVNFETVIRPLAKKLRERGFGDPEELPSEQITTTDESEIDSFEAHRRAHGR